MAAFDIKLLARDDGSWDAFEADWKAQCDEVDESYDDYAPDAFGVIGGIIDKSLSTVGGVSTTRVGALWDSESKRYYAACVLHRSLLPHTPGFTLRVRQLVVSPLLDYGVAEVQMYPDVVIGVLTGIIYLSSSVLQANNIHLHLRSPEDISFFRSLGMALSGANVFASVQTRGSWLYVEKVAAVGTGAAEELK